MKKNAISFIIAIALIAPLVGFIYGNVYAQDESSWSVSATNWMQYWHYNVIKGDSTTDINFLSHSREDSVDNRFIMDFNFGNFYAGGWFRVYEPLRPDASYEKLTQRYFGWSDNGITIHAGNFYQVFDRGLTLNTFYDDVVHSDNNLDGIKVSGLYDRYEFDVLSAREGIFGDNRANIIRGIRAAGKPLKPVKVGFSYVRIKQNSAFDPGAANINLTSVNSGINHGPLDLYGEYAFKRGTTDLGINSDGDGTYLSGSFSRKLLSVYAEYKNYFNLVFPSPGGAVNLPPPVSHSGRSLYSIESAPGERGYQIGTLISPSFNLNFEFSSSEAYARGRILSMQDSLRNYLGEKYAGLRWSPLSNLTLSYHWDRFDITANSEEFYGSKEINEVENYIDSYFYLTQTQTISVTASTRRFVARYSVGDTLRPYYPDYHEDFLTLGFTQGGLFQINVGSSISIKFRGARAGGPNAEPRNIAFVETLIHFGLHDLTVFYGRERGGLICSSGLCSYRSAFNGARIMLFSRF